ncbi:helix-turn-helix domain-containing protein [Streptomyces buecherae]|uniref:helix-turn-helix domain-containing protein n=1 Tax=Streptomyces buecherae TaxID=2763006 RepID=UPI0037ADB521
MGRALRDIRTQRGETQKDVGAKVGFSYSKLSRVESGIHDFKPRDIHRLLNAYGVVDPDERGRLVRLAEEANEGAWWRPWKDVATKQAISHVSFESMAQRVRSYEPAHLSGLLQIADYARAVISGGPEVPADAVDRLVELRLERQRQMWETPKKLIFIIDELTLVRGMGNPDVMRRQLSHLIELSEDPRYVFQVLELGTFNVPSFLGVTTIFDFAEQALPDIVYVEGLEGAQYLQDEGQVDVRKRMFDRARSISLERSRSVQRMRDLLKRS